MRDNQYTTEGRIRFSEVDHTRRITLPGIVNYFQDCSTFHSDSIGYGIEVMMEQGYAWILSSWQIIINRYPKFGEEITVSTWAHGWKAFFGYRNFKLEDTEGNLLAYANTNWIYMNIRTGHPERIPKLIEDFRGELTFKADGVQPCFIYEKKRRNLKEKQTDALESTKNVLNGLKRLIGEEKSGIIDPLSK